MTEAFLSTDEFSIYKNEKDKTFFTIEFEENSESLINSLMMNLGYYLSELHQLNHLKNFF